MLYNHKRHEIMEPLHIKGIDEIDRSQSLYQSIWWGTELMIFDHCFGQWRSKEGRASGGHAPWGAGLEAQQYTFCSHFNKNKSLLLQK